MRNFGDITQLVVHHSASRRNVTLEVIRAWHLKKGWSDIGYHYVIGEDGEPRVARPIGHAGAHCRKHNNYTVGVCVTGDNTVPGRHWLPIQVEGLMGLYRSLRLVWPEMTAVGHKDLAATECPGVDINGLLEEA